MEGNTLSSADKAVYILTILYMTGTDEDLKPADEGDEEPVLDPAAALEKERAEKEAALKQYAEASREAKFKNEEVKVLKDNTYLAKLAKNDKKMAERIAKDNW